MKLIYHIILSPFAAFAMILVWAALFGDSVVIFNEHNMMEEWIICILCYMLFYVIFSLARKNKVDIDEL